MRVADFYAPVAIFSQVLFAVIVSLGGLFLGVLGSFVLELPYEQAGQKSRAV